MEIIRHSYNTPNMAKPERAASIAVGTVLTYYGLKQRSKIGVGLAVMGAALIRRGVTGFCYTYQALGIRTADRGQGENISIPYELGVRVDKAITVNKPRADVYAFWRDVENMSRFMEHLESVRTIDSTHSHWVAKGPAGQRVEWDAQIINEIPNELIGWRSLPGADVDNAGSVRFEEAEGGRGTVVRVSLQYNPPGGAISAALSKLFGKEPGQEIEKDLRRFKAILETGEVPTSTGQTSGRVAEHHHSEKARKHDEEVMNASEASFPASDAPGWH